MTRVIFILFGVFVATSIAALQWKQLAPSNLPDGPVGRTAPSNVLYRDSIIMYGGANHCGDDRPTYNDTWLFNLTTLKWTQLLTSNDPPLARWGHFAWMDALFDPDSMLIFGGRNGEEFNSQPPFSDVWRLNLKTLIWSKLNDGIAGKTIMVDNSGAVTTSNGKMYFVNTNRAVPGITVATEIWKYEVSINSFTPIPISSSFVPMQEWLFSVVAVKFDQGFDSYETINDSEYLVVYGGWEQNQFYSFNMQTGVFSNLTAFDPTPPASAGHEAISAQTLTGEPVYMIWSANSKPEFWLYSYGDRSWTSMNVPSAAPSPRLYTQIVPARNNAPVSLLAPIIWYVVAGHDINTDRCLSDVWLLGNREE